MLLVKQPYSPECEGAIGTTLELYVAYHSLQVHRVGKAAFRAVKIGLVFWDLRPMLIQQSMTTSKPQWGQEYDCFQESPKPHLPENWSAVWTLLSTTYGNI